MNFEKLLDYQVFKNHNCNLFQSFKFAIRFRPLFVLPVVLIPLFHVLSNHFEVPLSLVAGFTV